MTLLGTPLKVFPKFAYAKISTPLKSFLLLIVTTRVCQNTPFFFFKSQSTQWPEKLISPLPHFTIIIAKRCLSTTIFCFYSTTLWRHPVALLGGFFLWKTEEPGQQRCLSYVQFMFFFFFVFWSNRIAASLCCHVNLICP